MRTRLNVQDFRTHETAVAKWNPDLLAELDNINVLIDAMADLREVEPSLFPNQLPVLKTSSSPSKMALSERERLGLTLTRQEAWTSMQTASDDCEP